MDLDTLEYNESKVTLAPDAIVFLESTMIIEVIDTLFSQLDSALLRTFDLEDLKKKIFERELLCSTSIGSQIAIPHLKIQGLDRFYMALGIHKEGIEWGAMDGGAVHLVLLIVGPDVDPIYYLNYLSSLTRHLKNEKLKEKLLGCSTIQEAYHTFMT
ncbi:MAG: PTS sugar transporter subunit IIA [Chlamydiia bacterium]